MIPPLPGALFAGCRTADKFASFPVMIQALEIFVAEP